MKRTNDKDLIPLSKDGISIKFWPPGVRFLRAHYIFEHEGLPRSLIIDYGKIILPPGVPKNTPALKAALALAKDFLRG